MDWRVREEPLGEMLLARIQPRTGLGTHVTADPFGNPAEVVRGAGFGYLLGLAVHIVNHVMRAHQDTTPTLAAAAIADHFVHHLLESRNTHGCLHTGNLSLGLQHRGSRRVGQGIPQARGQWEEKLALVFGRYEERLRASCAVDFDDLLLKSV